MQENQGYQPHTFDWLGLIKTIIPQLQRLQGIINSDPEAGTEADKEVRELITDATDIVGIAETNKATAPTNFLEELTRLINKYNRERGSNTPDYILAAYLQNALAAFDAAVNHRENWYGRENFGPGKIDESRAEHIKALTAVLQKNAQHLEDWDDHAAVAYDYFEQIGAVGAKTSFMHRLNERIKKTTQEVMQEIEEETRKTAGGDNAKKAQALRELMNSPYGAALGKNAPEITVGMKFLNEHQPGQLYTVVKLDTEKNSIDVDIQFQDRTWTDTGWDLQHTIWGFERGEYWQVPENTVIVKVLVGCPGEYAIQTPGIKEGPKHKSGGVVPGEGGPWGGDREVADAIVDRHLDKMRNREWKESPHTLDEKGFFFYLKTGGIGWCRMYGGTPWFMAQTADGQWYTGKQVNQTEIWNAKASEVSAEEDAALRKTLPNE